MLPFYARTTNKDCNAAFSLSLPVSLFLSLRPPLSSACIFLSKFSTLTAIPIGHLIVFSLSLPHTHDPYTHTRAHTHTHSLSLFLLQTSNDKGVIKVQLGNFLILQCGNFFSFRHLQSFREKKKPDVAAATGEFSLITLMEG